MSVNPVDPVLLVAWLVFAHLVADFVLQDDWIAINKGRGTPTGLRALGLHGLHVALCLVPVALAFGARGAVYVVVVALTHVVVDRWKVRATQRMDGRAQEQARERLARGALSGSGLGAAWTPWPGMLFLADQALHLAIALAGWLVILEGAPLLPAFVDVVDAVIRGWDQATFHAAVLTGVVLVSLFLVNTRGAFYFAMALVSPRSLRPVPGEAEGAPVSGAAPVPAAHVPGAPAADAPAAGTSGGDGAPAAGMAAAGRAAPTGASARIEATAQALERLLVASLILAGAAPGAVIVIAVDVAVHWRQLGDRGYAEWYLVATLGSVSVALGSALLALAALSSLG